MHLNRIPTLFRGQTLLSLSNKVVLAARLRTMNAIPRNFIVLHKKTIFEKHFPPSSAVITIKRAMTRTIIPRFAVAIAALIQLIQVKEVAAVSDVQLLIYETEISIDAPVNNLVSQANRIPGLTTTVVGQGKKFDGFGSKYEAVLPLLQQMDSDTLVVLSDARDVLINNPIDDIDNVSAMSAIEDFRAAFEMISFQQPGAIIVSAEAQCCVSALTYARPGAYFDVDGTRSGRACSSGESDCLWNGDENAIPWENFMKDVAQQRLGVGASVIDDIYLNSGLIVGLVGDVLRVLTAADILASEDDQAVLTDYMHRNPRDIILDYGQTMFGNNRGGLEGGSMESCMFTVSSDSNRLVHKKTSTTPLFVHSPGGYLQCHDDLAAKLGVVAMSAKARRRLREWKSRTLNYRFCPQGQKLVSGFCVSDSCTQDFQCPSNSFRLSGSHCYDSFDDCQCNNGYFKSNGVCVQVPSLSKCYDCPVKSNPLSTFNPNYQCVNTMDDCRCNNNYKYMGGNCVAHWCVSDYQCPLGKTRIPGRECYDTIHDCQ